MARRDSGVVPESLDYVHCVSDLDLLVCLKFFVNIHTMYNLKCVSHWKIPFCIFNSYWPKMSANLKCLNFQK